MEITSKHVAGCMWRCHGVLMRSSHEPVVHGLVCDVDVGAEGEVYGVNGDNSGVKDVSLGSFKARISKSSER